MAFKEKVVYAFWTHDTSQRNKATGTGMSRKRPGRKTDHIEEDNIRDTEKKVKEDSLKTTEIKTSLSHHIYFCATSHLPFPHEFCSTKQS